MLNVAFFLFLAQRLWPCIFAASLYGSFSMAVISDARTGLVRRGLMVLLAMGLLSRGLAADTNAPPPVVNNEESLRASLQLQEQLRATQLAIERNRLEAEVQSASNAAVFSDRLDQLEKSLAVQRLKDLTSIEQSENRTILVAVSAFGCITFLILIVVGYFQMTAVNRLAAAAARMSAARPVAALGLDEGHLPPSQLLAQSNARFLEVIERMEQRIRQFEMSSKTSNASPEHGPGNGASTEALPKPLALKPAEEPGLGVADRVSVLVGKSQTLMKMGQPEAALAVLDEALVADPENTDAFIKKGAVLERLNRVDEAIRCFDRAITIDRSVTMAYLLKGSLFNRMERFDEALACYEQALKIKQAGNAPDFSVPSS
jgi:tetratricopeptide (TPR) repeat protein